MDEIQKKQDILNAEKIEVLQDLINKAKRIVFFGGAGVSTDSGIPDFRSKDGLYNQSYKFSPEFMLSHSCFEVMPDEFFRFYNDKILCCLKSEPNYTHKFLTKLEQQGKLVSVITQNIDGLHEKANTKTIRLLHGTVMKNYCTRCGKFYSVDYLQKDIQNHKLPKCNCGGIIKPDVVLYEECLDNDVVTKAVNDIINCDMLIIGGTSLAVNPAASFVEFFRGDKLVIINKDATPKDSEATLVIHGSLSEIFKQIDIGCEIE